jgi:hypothetical protein
MLAYIYVYFLNTNLRLNNNFALFAAGFACVRDNSSFYA